jgi:hypothetical protein
VLLFVLAGLGVLVLEDEMNLDLSALSAVALDLCYLVGGAALVGAKHDDIGGGVGELLGLELLVVTKKLHVCTAALEALLEFDLVLHNECLALVVNLGGELG